MRKILAAVSAAMTMAAIAGSEIQLTNPSFETTEKGRAVGWKYPARFQATRGGLNGSGALEWSGEGGEVFDECAVQKLGPLEAGRRYDFSAMVRVEGLKLERKSPRKGAGLMFSGYDREGKRIFFSSTQVMASGTADWQKVEALSKEVPEGVVRSELRLWIRGVTGGRARFDNVFAALHEIRPVQGVYTSAYRREGVEGKYVFAAVLNYTGESKNPADYRAEFSYTDARGELRRVDAPELTRAGAKVELDVGGFRMGESEVRCRLFLGGREMGEASMKFTRLAEPVKRKVSLDRYGRTIIDGKPVFLFGMSSDLEIDDWLLDRYAEGPFNIILGYRNFSRETLDRVWKRGIYYAISLGKNYEDADFGRAKTREAVLQYKDHPALAFWYISDERPLAYVPRIAERKELIYSLDPDHPTRGAQDLAYEGRNFLDAYDIVACDPYPIGRNGGDGQPISTVIETMRTINAETLGTRSLQHIPQFFGWAWLSRKETLTWRTPTPREMANMAWQMLAGGAKGLIGYNFGQLMKKVRPNGRAEEAAEVMWPPMREFCFGIRKYEEVFLSVDEPIAITAGETATIAARTWRSGGDDYLLVVNASDKPQTAAIELARAPGRLVGCEFAAAPAVNGKSVVFGLGPLDYAMVRFAGSGR